VGTVLERHARKSMFNWNSRTRFLNRGPRSPWAPRSGSPVATSRGLYCKTQVQQY